MARNPFAGVRGFLLGAAAVLLPALAPSTSAQALTPAEWHHGTSLALFGGFTSPDDGARASLGGSIGWEITRRVALEAGGLWFPAADDGDVVFGSVGARFVLPAPGRVAPFVNGGVGLFRASMRENDTRMSDFYRHRMDAAVHGMPRLDTRQHTFDDFAFRLGGGAEFFAGRHISIRPAFELIVVTRRPDVQLVPSAGVHLAYHFESHVITPSRR